MYTVSSKGPSKIVNKTRRGLNQKLDSGNGSSSIASGGGSGVIVGGIRSSSTSSGAAAAATGGDGGRHASTSTAAAAEEEPVEMSSPKPVFHPVNGKRSSGSQRISVEITPQHEDIIKYISEDWNRVYREYEMTKQQGLDSRGISNVVYYQGTAPNQLLQNFKPFDLEMWWGQRFFQNITKDT